jgi:hypothetical protein
MDENTQTDGATDQEKLVGFTRETVTYPDGREEVVNVKLLNVRQITRFIAVGEDPAAAAELFCGKPNGWADTITPESVYRVVATGERVNKSPFVRHLAFLNERGARTQSINAQLNPSPASSPASASKQD